MSSGIVNIGNFIAVFLCHFMPHCSKGLAGSYMWSAMTESLVLSGKLHIITSHRYALEFDVNRHKRCCYNYQTFLAPSN